MLLKAPALSPRKGEGGAHPAWWLARGAYSTDGPVTRENLVSPRLKSGDAGTPVTGPGQDGAADTAVLREESVFASR